MLIRLCLFCCNVREEKERGALVIVSCHTAEVLESVADEIYRMDFGQVKEHIVC